MNPDAPDPFAGPPPGTPDDDDGPVPTLLALSWQQAEALLYPAALEQPEVYQRVIRLVRGTADHLRLLGTGTSALAAAAERCPELVAAVVDESGVQPGDLDLGLLARAALALRYRELRGEQAARRRLRRVDEARQAGRAWVVVEETGASDGDPFVPYSRLEVEVGTGRALLVTAAPDDDYREVQHQVRPVRLDPATGEVLEDPAGPEATTHADAAARDAHAAQWRGEPGGP
jgi:hypothetical protein